MSSIHIKSECHCNVVWGVVINPGMATDTALDCDNLSGMDGERRSDMQALRQMITAVTSRFLINIE